MKYTGPFSTLLEIHSFLTGVVVGVAIDSDNHRLLQAISDRSLQEAGEEPWYLGGGILLGFALTK